MNRSPEDWADENLEDVLLDDASPPPPPPLDAGLEEVARKVEGARCNGKISDSEADAICEAIDGCRMAPSLPYADLSLPLKPREWLVHERIPMNNVTLVSGEGAAGKSTLLMQLAGSTTLGKGWLGLIPMQGAALYVTCEEDADEARRRMEAVAADLGSTRRDLVDNGLRVLSFAGKDAVLTRPTREGLLVPTRLFTAISVAARESKPKLIVIDTAADTFGGREIDRGQVRQYITMLRGLATGANAALMLASHPSLTGIHTDTGISGSTGWYNSVRAHAYFKAAPGEDTTLRVLEFRKNNYGPPDAPPILLRWQNGVYVVDPGAGSFAQLAAEAEMDQLFLTLLRRFEAQDRNVSDKPSATYAPIVFLDEPEAKAAKVTKRKFAEAMARLFAAKKIRVVEFGPPARRRSKISENIPSNAKIYPFRRPSDPPDDPGSNAVSTPFQEGCNTPPIPPAPLEGANGASREVGPAPTNEPDPPKAPLPRVGYEVLGVAPAGERCTICGGGKPRPMRIKHGEETDNWHTACADKCFAAANPPTPVNPS